MRSATCRRLAQQGVLAEIGEMSFDQPYLETCCRSALHRLLQSASIGRPPALKDGPCLTRLAGMGLARRCETGKFVITAAGRTRHGSEIGNLTVADSA